MTKISAIIITVIATLAHLGGASIPSPVVDVAPPAKKSAKQAAISVGATPNISVAGAGADEMARLDKAVDLFRDNGLHLPDIQVRFFDNETDCRGHYGLFQQGPTPWRVLICSDLAFVLPHELAHAWAAANLTDDDRERYVQTRGLTNWNDHDAPWKERGAEDAAFIIQQNLTARNPPMASPTWQQRTAAYRVLTGRGSPIQADRLAHRL